MWWEFIMDNEFAKYALESQINFEMGLKDIPLASLDEFRGGNDDAH